MRKVNNKEVCQKAFVVFTEGCEALNWVTGAEGAIEVLYFSEWADGIK